MLYNTYRHLTEQFLTMVAAIESDTVPKGKHDGGASYELPPMLQFPAEELQQVGEELHRDFPSIKGKRLILVNPSGGILPIRAWPLESYVTLCNELLQRGFAVGVIGLPDDKPYGIAVTKQCNTPCCVDLTGYTRSVRHLLAVFHCADLLISNDGGPGQFAAITPLPTIVFFGPETPVLYGTLNRNAYSFFTNYPCSPCLTAYNHRNSPCDGDNQCIKSITPQQVLDKALELLAAPVASGNTPT